MRRRIGAICISISVFSRVNRGFTLLVLCVNGPRCVEVNICSEYSAVISILNPVNVMVKLDQEKAAKIVDNSPSRLIVGGRARLARFARSHQRVRSGNSVWRPRVNIIVRL